MAKEGEEIVQNAIFSENLNADSNLSDAALTSIIPKTKKKSLTDMLKKLHDGNNVNNKPEIPVFLQKGIKDKELPKISVNGVSSDSKSLLAVNYEKKSEIKVKINNQNDINKNLNKTDNNTKLQFDISSTEKSKQNIGHPPPSNLIGTDDVTKKQQIGGKQPSGQARVTSLKTNTDIYKCHVEECKQFFGNTNDFQSHVLTTHPNLTNIPCCFCFDNLPSNNLLPHLSSHIKNVMKCLYCQVSHDTREELLKHLTEKHSNQPKKINVCIRILNNLRGKRMSDKNHGSKERNGVSSNKVSNSLKKDSPSKFFEGFLSGNKETKKDIGGKFFENSNVVNRENEKESALVTLSSEANTTQNSKANTTQISEAGIQKNDQTQKSRSRKCLKPVKTQRSLVLEDEVQVKWVEERDGCGLGVSCQKCTYTTATESCMKQHCIDVHSNEGAVLAAERVKEQVGYFECKHCSMKTDLKSEFLNHLSHHKLPNKTQAVRFYTCSYCATTSTSMHKMEDHIEQHHPSESFKFEVSQQFIVYLQHLLTCPVCMEAYRWKESFLHHLQCTHKLHELAAFLVHNFSEDLVPVGNGSSSCNTQGGPLSVPRWYFRNLLPDAPDCESEKVAKEVAVDGLDDCMSNNDNMEATDGGDALKDDGIHDDNNNNVILSTEQVEDKTEGLLTDHPLLYNMLSRGHTATSAATTLNDSLNLVAEGTSGKKDYVEFTDRFPPADLVKYVIKKSVPTTFNCNLCPFECSKTTHFRRHLEIHKRNESLKEGYKCGHCEFMHYRLNCIRFHLGKYHSSLPYKIFRIIDDSLIILGVDDDPTLKKSKAKNPFLSSTSSNFSSTSTPLTTSIPVQRPERDRRPPAKLECDFAFPSSSTVKTGNASMDELLTFEKQLPTSMIFPLPIQCPKCDFSNRVRINLLKHLKLHKDVIQNSSIVSPAPLELEDGSVEVLKNVTMSYITRANLSEEYHQFSVKLPNLNHYMCKECNFTHRYPSKVKRHFYYKHAATFPYKCGYCSFGAVEGGKVRRHCKLMHPCQSEMVVKRNVYKRCLSEDEADDAVALKRVKLELEDTEEDGVKVKNEWWSVIEAAKKDLWLPQFVTVLEDDDVQCCKLCGYQQGGASSLREHVINNHLELYPYSCSYCGFALMDISRVTKHIDTHHPDQPYAAIKRHPSLPQDVTEEEIYDDNELPNDCSQDSTGNDESSQGNLNDSQLGAEGDDSPLGTEKEFGCEEDDDEHGDQDKDEMKNFLYESLTMIPHEADNNNNNNNNNNNSFNGKRRYKCHYCGVVSKWNRRDIRLHILHVHMKKKVYTCKHCGFGNSKSKVLVRSHCLNLHPDKPVAVKDDLVLFNSIVPLEDSNGIVTMVMCNKEGNPILSIPQDEEFDVKLIYNQRSISKPPKAFEVSFDKSTCLQSDRWKCKLCTYASTNELDVKHHIISLHLNVRAFSCPHCHVYIKREDLVLAHIDKYHPEKERVAVDTLKEKAQYLRGHMECLVQQADSPLVASPMASMVADGDEDVIDEGFARVMEQQTNPRYSSGYFRCMICGYRDPRNDKTKYHIIKTHLNLRQFSCPYCCQYMWGRQQVMCHIQLEHPGKEVVVKRTFHQYDQFLRKNIKKFPYNKNLVKVRPLSDNGGSGYNSANDDNPTSLVIAPEMKNRLFQCFYCDFKHALVAQIQSHCMQEHPSDLVRFKQVDEDEFKNFSEDDEFEASEAALKTMVSEAADKKGTFICQHCELVKWTEKDMSKHLLDIHQDQGASYTFVSSDLFSESNLADESAEENGQEEEEEEEEVVAVADDDEEYFPTKKMSLLNARQNNSYINSAGIKMTNVANTKFSHLTSNDLLKSKASLYQCKLCSYKSNKMTVMRHHVMSHLRYHPYVCPYCNVAKSVKSFPVKKHVLAKHPGKEVKAMHCVDKDIEKKICNSYFRIKVSSMGSRSNASFRVANNYDRSLDATAADEGSGFEEGDNDDHHNEEAVDEEDDDGGGLGMDISDNMQNSTAEKALSKECQEKVLEPQSYKCKFCAFTTILKSSMKHHLMKELNYKPFKCNHCAFRDAIRPSLSKHHQLHHSGLVDVTQERNEEKEGLVNQMLIECEVHDTSSLKPTTQNPFHKLPIQITNQSLLPMLAKESKLYKCPDCAYTNSTLKLVRGHMVKHGPYRLKCAYCPYKAHYPSRIRKHNRRQHHGLMAKCLKVVQAEEEASGESRVPVVVEKKQQLVVASDEDDSRASLNVAGQVFLDGVPIDLPLVADRDGWFRCQFCNYESLNRDNFKVHLVTHKPPRWKCYYCPQKYPVVFRVRRHCSMKHPNSAVKWVDVQTNKVCGDFKQTPNKFTSILHHKDTPHPFSLDHQFKKTIVILPKLPQLKGYVRLPNEKTARKSSLPFYRQLQRATKHPLPPFEALLPQQQDDPLPEWRSVELGLRIYRYCCHLCSFSHVSHRPVRLFSHLKIEHFHKHLLPPVEVLPRSEGAELWALKRCGFCAFETYDSRVFCKHVDKHTHCQPVQCLLCAFASFSASLVAQHVAEQHPQRYHQIKHKFLMAVNDDDDNDDKAEVYTEKGNRVVKEYDDDSKDSDQLVIEESSEGTQVPDRFFCKRLTDDYTMAGEGDKDTKQLDWSCQRVLKVNLTLHYSLDDHAYNASESEEEDEEEDEEDADDNDHHNSDDDLREENI